MFKYIYRKRISTAIIFMTLSTVITYDGSGSFISPIWFFFKPITVASFTRRVSLFLEN